MALLGSCLQIPQHSEDVFPPAILNQALIHFTIGYFSLNSRPAGIFQ